MLREMCGMCAHGAGEVHLKWRGDRRTWGVIIGDLVMKRPPVEFSWDWCEQKKYCGFSSKNWYLLLVSVRAWFSSKISVDYPRTPLTPLQTLTDSPQKLHRNGQSIKIPVTRIFFLHKYLAYHMIKPIPMEEKFQKLKTQSCRALKCYYVVLKVSCGLVTNRQVMTYNTVKTFSSPTNLSHLL